MNYEDVKKWIEDRGFQNNALRSDRNHRIDLYLSDLLHAFAADLVNKNDLLSDVSERYFVVGYVANVPNGHVTGNIDITTSGKYLNRALTIECIKEKDEDRESIVITNVIELSEDDFNSWRNDL